VNGQPWALLVWKHGEHATRVLGIPRSSSCPHAENRRYSPNVDKAGLWTASSGWRYRTTPHRISMTEPYSSAHPTKRVRRRSRLPLQCTCLYLAIRVTKTMTRVRVKPKHRCCFDIRPGALPQDQLRVWWLTRELLAADTKCPAKPIRAAREP
jgi:hypothetical protein